ncbi:MAG: ASKHA domain-containing protein [Victivallaceae bacterium]|nr:ASKHA domain-containing protein [Victivallaceae bacterium]
MALTVKTSQQEYSVEIIKERRLSFMIQQAGVPLDLQCSGLGICGKCAVEVGAGRYRCEDEEFELTEGESRNVLSCRTYILSETAAVVVPEIAILKSSGKIYNDFELGDFEFNSTSKLLNVTIPEATLDAPVSDWQRLKTVIIQQTGIVKMDCCLVVLRKLPELLKQSNSLSVSLARRNDYWQIIDLTADSTPRDNLGVAVDIGTTTVALILVDMNNGEIISRASAYNQQMSRADDVASRISAAGVGNEDLNYMQDLVINDTINKLIDEACEQADKHPEMIIRLAVSGNTVMTHLFLGISPTGIGSLPFQPVTADFPDTISRELGLNMHPCGIVSIVPAISGYIGGDITSDLRVTDMDGDAKLSVLVDLGTNSEMVVRDENKMFAAAAAAGPAFEGAGILCGCRATAGAIEHIKFGRELDFENSTIEHAKPIGICGSAIIDFIAEGFRCGLINMMGRFDIDLLKQQNCYYLFDTVHSCILVPKTSSATGEDIIVTEKDIEQILKAKGAVYAGLQTMLTERGKTFADLDKLVLAGGFAKYIDLGNAITIGMLPEISREKVSSIGNGSLAGAYLNLLDYTVNDEFRKIAAIPKVVALNLVPAFEMNYVDAMMLPNYDASLFPETMTQIH